MIEIDVQKQLGNFRIDLQFKSASKGITILSGPSGSGKTSLIFLIAGLLKPDSGKIVVNNQILFDSCNRIDIPVHKRKCGCVFQDGKLFPHLNVQNNLLFGVKNSKHAQLENITSLLGISHLLKRMPTHLSGGEKQRVALGRALLMKPEILLMDEPLASLDADRKNELLPYISSLPETFGIPVVYVTHSQKEILLLGDHLVRIKNGKVESYGQTIGEIKISGRSNSQDYTVSVMEGYPESYDPKLGIQKIRFSGGILFLILKNPISKFPVKIGINSMDVAISLEKPKDISVQNIFQGSIIEIESVEQFFSLITVDIGVLLKALITKASNERLCLKVGMTVFAMVKTVSLNY
ncbi:MAG: molybdenum ABC transporter ATP-binding protein [Leptospiraceae bacterium]|nr:molybdenum ABC transporter ATP-binding protein [Leptospiraceae bacterium]